MTHNQIIVTPIGVGTFAGLKAQAEGRGEELVAIDLHAIETSAELRQTLGQALEQLTAAPETHSIVFDACTFARTEILSEAIERVGAWCAEHREDPTHFTWIVFSSVRRRTTTEMMQVLLPLVEEIR